MIDIYNQPAKTVIVLCHTSLGDPLDEKGRFFTKGNEYKLSTEITTPYRLLSFGQISEGPDTNNQECILCWISTIITTSTPEDLQSKAMNIMMVNQDGHTSPITLSVLFKEKEIIN